MKSHKGFGVLETILIVSVVALLIVVGYLVWDNYKGRSIGSFEDCVKAGNPVAESSPRQCFTEDGRGFTEKVKSQPDAISEESSSEYTSDQGETIVVDKPGSNATVSSPLVVSGQVPGSWSFEASFPIRVIDADGKVLVEEPVQLTGDWMTKDLVPFKITLEFDGPSTPTGTLMLVKDNPSGLSEHEDKLSIPIKFSSD